MHKRLEKILRAVIIFWGVYLISEALLYLFDIRLLDVKSIWLPSAIVYAKFIERILGSAFLFIAIVIFEVQKDLDKYRNFIILSAIWTVFHGGLLIFFSLTQNYIKIYASLPSLYVWLPLYNLYLLFEGLILISYSLLVYFWAKND